MKDPTSQALRYALDNRLASEGQCRTLIETTGAGYLILDPQGRVLDANAEYVHLTGHSVLNDILGRFVTEWTASDSTETLLCALAQCVQEGRIRNLAVDYVNDSGQKRP